MFDCPEQSQTSPTSTSAISAWASPAVRRRAAGLASAGIASSASAHVPSPPTVAAAVRSPSVTLTFSPASPVPQTVSGQSRCTTMWSLK